MRLSEQCEQWNPKLGSCFACDNKTKSEQSITKTSIRFKCYLVVDQVLLRQENFGADAASVDLAGMANSHVVLGGKRNSFNLGNFEKSCHSPIP